MAIKAGLVPAFIAVGALPAPIPIRPAMLGLLSSCLSFLDKGGLTKVKSDRPRRAILSKYSGPPADFAPYDNVFDMLYGIIDMMFRQFTRTPQQMQFMRNPLQPLD